MIEKQECISNAAYEAAESIAAAGKENVLIAKADVKGAFRLLKLARACRRLMGCKWRGQYWADLAMSFGTRSAPPAWGEVAAAIRWILQRAIERECPGALRGPVLVHGDDFLFIFAAGQAERAWQVALSVFARLGVPLGQKKLASPCKRLTYCGIVYDLESGQVSIPPLKLKRLAEAAAGLCGKEQAEAREVMSLLGRLNHCRTACPPAYFFGNALWDAAGGKDKRARVGLSERAKKDMRTFARFLSGWNGVGFLPPGQQNERVAAADRVFTSDAAVAWGMGAWCDVSEHETLYYAQAWDEADMVLAFATSEDGEGPRMKGCSTAYLELRALLACLDVLASEGVVAKQRVVARCDNKAVVSMINKGRARSGPTQRLLRVVGALLAKHRIWLRAVHLPGSENQRADDLSRAQLNAFEASCGSRRSTRKSPRSLEQMEREYGTW